MKLPCVLTIRTYHVYLPCVLTIRTYIRIQQDRLLPSQHRVRCGETAALPVPHQSNQEISWSVILFSSLLCSYSLYVQFVFSCWYCILLLSGIHTKKMKEIKWIIFVLNKCNEIIDRWWCLWMHTNMFMYHLSPLLLLSPVLFFFLICSGAR